MKIQVQQMQVIDESLNQPGFFGSIMDLIGDDDTQKPPRPIYCPWCRSGAHKEVRENYAERFMNAI